MNTSIARPTLLLGLLVTGVALSACGGRGDTVDSANDPDAIPTAASAGLLSNSGFDSASIEPWSSAVHADPLSYEIGTDSETRHAGTASVRIHGKGSEPWGGITQTIDAAALAGQQLELSAWVRGQNLAQAVTLMATFDNGAFVEPIERAFPELGANYDWQRISMKIEMPATPPPHLRLGVILNGAGTVWVDEVLLVKAGD